MEKRDAVRDGRDRFEQDVPRCPHRRLRVCPNLATMEHVMVCELCGVVVRRESLMARNARALRQVYVDAGAELTPPDPPNYRYSDDLDGVPV
jgi:hypothetical protein